MSNHRVERLLPVQMRLPKFEQAANVPSGFVLLPACFTMKQGSALSLFQSAYAAAQQEVDAKQRQKRREAFLWN